MRQGRDVSVVVTDGDVDRVAATLDELSAQAVGGTFLEVVVVRRWPGSPVTLPPANGLELRVLDVAAASPTAAANAGLAAAGGDAVVLLSAGDEPQPGLIAGHLEALHAGAAAVVGGVAGDDALRDAWVGLWPVGVPPPPVRHVALRRSALRDAGGLDERLPELEVGVVDLLARLAESGAAVTVRRDLEVRGATLGRARLAEAGRSAHALALLLSERGAASHSRGPRRARVTLRWCEPALRALAGVADGRVVRLVRRAAFARGLGRYPPAVEPTARGGLTGPPGEPLQRPPVAVVVPFAGTAADAADLLAALDGIRRRPGDELVVVDNSRAPVVEPRPGVRVVRADGEWSSYHARNAGWPAAAAPWVLFTDSDCHPAPSILDAYFSPQPGEDAGAVAGAVLAAPGSGWAARYSEGVEVLSQARSLGRETRPYAVTANLLVRRSALEELGGFAESVRSAGDTDLSWRLLDCGWSIEHRPAAAVLHIHRESVRELLRQYRRYGAGAAWLGRRYPGAFSGWPRFHRSMVAVALTDLAAGRFELALLRLTDIATTAAAWLGARGSNRPPRTPPRAPAEAVAFADAFPDAEAGEQIARPVPGVAVEARRRPRRFAYPRPDVEVAYAEDDATGDRLAALRWLAGRPGGRRGVAAAALGGHGELRALAADAAVARRVAARAPKQLTALDDGAATAAALQRTADVLGIPLDRPAASLRPGAGA